MAQRTRLCVTFEMDHHHNHHNDEEIYIENNDRRNSYTTISNRTNSDRLCLQDADLQG